MDADFKRINYEVHYASNIEGSDFFRRGATDILFANRKLQVS